MTTTIERVRVIDLLCEGPIEGWQNGSARKSVFFDNTPVESEAGDINYADTQVQLLEGEGEQSFSGDLDVGPEETISIGVQVTKANPVSRTIDAPTAKILRVNLTFDGLWDQDEDGDFNKKEVRFRVWYHDDEDENFKLAIDETIRDDKTSSFLTSYEIEVDGVSPWTVRVERVSNDDSRFTEKSSFSLTSIVAITPVRMQYMDSAVVGLRMNAKSLGGRVPNRSYAIYGRKILVPSNYDPDTREYEGIWEFTFSDDRVYCDNPAWVLFDVLTDERCGAGISVDRIDLLSFYEAAQFCDELVDTPNGQEPRFVFAGVIDTAENLATGVQAIANSFHATVVSSGGIVYCMQDRPADIAMVVTPANVVDGEIVYPNQAGVSEQPTVINVSYLTDDGSPGVVTVEDPEMIRKFGYRSRDVQPVGIGSKHQAFRHGWWMLLTERYQRNLATWRAGLSQCILKPWDIVAIADPTISGAQYGGLTTATSSTSVTLDRSISIPAGSTLILVNEDLSTTEYSIGPVSGDTITVNLDPVPPPGTIWAVSTPDAAVKYFRILSVKEVEDGTQVEITALEHYPEKWTAIEQKRFIEPADTIVDAVPPVPTNLSSTRFYDRNGKDILRLDWSRVDAGRQYAFEVQALVNESWVSITESTTNTSFSFTPSSDTSSVRVRALSLDGRISPWVTSTSLGTVIPVSLTVTANRLEWDVSGTLEASARMFVFINGALVTTVDAASGSVDVTLPSSGTVRVALSAVSYAEHILQPLGQVTLSITTTSAVVSGITYTRSTLAWGALSGSSYYEVWRLFETADWVLLGTTQTLSYAVPELVGTSVGRTASYAVVAVKQDGSKLAPAAGAQTSASVIADTTAPAAPAGLRIEETASGIRRLVWAKAPEADFAGYELKTFRLPENDLRWDTGKSLFEGRISQNYFELLGIPSWVFYIGVRAVDTSGNTSPPTYVALNLGDRIPENVVFEANFAPSWAGTLIEGTLTSGVLVGGTGDTPFWST